MVSAGMHAHDQIKKTIAHKRLIHDGQLGKAVWVPDSGHDSGKRAWFRKAGKAGNAVLVPESGHHSIMRQLDPMPKMFSAKCTKNCESRSSKTDISWRWLTSQSGQPGQLALPLLTTPPRQ